MYETTEKLNLSIGKRRRFLRPERRSPTDSVKRHEPRAASMLGSTSRRCEAIGGFDVTLFYRLFSGIQHAEN